MPPQIVLSEDSERYIEELRHLIEQEPALAGFEIDTVRTEVEFHRRLPEWTVSWAQHRARLATRPDGRPVPMNSPEQMVRVPRADTCLGALTASGRYPVDRWLRMDHLVEDFTDLISSFVEVDDAARARIAAFPDVNALQYDHDPSHWFTPERLRRLYENNPLWAAAERAAYGDLAFV